MAPPTNAPRLAHIDPAALVAEIHETLTGHLGRLAFVANPALAETVRDLCTYAQIGTGLDGPVEDYLQTVFFALYQPPVRANTNNPAWEEVWSRSARAVPDSLHGRLCVVCGAALARQALANGNSVPIGWLAHLANVGHKLAEAEGLGRERGEVEHADALRWAKARGIAGL